MNNSHREETSVARSAGGRGGRALFLAVVCVSLMGARVVAAEPAVAARQITALRQTIADLRGTYGTRYPRGAEFASRLESLAAAAGVNDPAVAASFAALQREALLANPLLDFQQLLVVKRKSLNVRGGNVLWSDRETWQLVAGNGLDLGLPSNHECNASLDRLGYDNELAVLSPVRAGRLRTLYRPAHGGYVGEADLHWDGNRLLFSQSDAANWKIWEIRADGSHLRQVSQMPDDVDCFDPCYLPNGKIIFGSTASFQSVPCWHGQKRVSNLYLMNADGSSPRQLCFDQDHDFHATVLPTGQVLYHRWDYTGINHIFLRQLMVMNPDGTGQRAIYGSSSWYPNSLYFPRAAPGDATRLVSILSGYHGVHRMGQMVVLDVKKGWQEAEGMVKRISGRGDPINPIIRDNLVDKDWPKFLHPFPLSDKYFLVACLPGPKGQCRIYLADIFDNLILLREEPGYALLEPVPLKSAPTPPVIPERVELARKDASVYLHDVYAGPGLAGVPHGTVKSLRVVAYHFGYRNLAGPDKIGYGGPWEVMRILGTVPLEKDGSAFFRVPANTPIAVQPLDSEGKAVQLMRSWFTAMPGETVSCVGCHESPKDAPATSPASAAMRVPREITPWRGPARGFDFEREVQPVLTQYCVGCHRGNAPAPTATAAPSAAPDLRALVERPEYAGIRVSDMEINRLHPTLRAASSGFFKYTPAYDALLPYVRRVGIEDDVSLLVPAELHADTSPLIQLLRKGHAGVRLDAEAWDRLVTWIDLNAPCHGTWHEVFPFPDDAHERRMELRRLCGGLADDPEVVLNSRTSLTNKAQQAAAAELRAVTKTPSTTPTVVSLRRATAAPRTKTVSLGGAALKLVLVPAGEFSLGDTAGEPDEQPVTSVTIKKPFWMGECEVSNEQFRQFNAGHDSRYYTKRHALPDDKGLSLNDPRQPVVRVSWEEAMSFCRWLSSRTGLRFNLPTEAQWEWACRAGNSTPLAFGGPGDDFSSWANMADASFSRGLMKGGKQITGGLDHLMLDGAALSSTRFNDRAVVTATIASYQPNAWGIYDLHGNAAEWTRSTQQPYPYREDDGRNTETSEGRKVVRGGSFFDPPARCRGSFRLAYPAWQRVFNVGFRVMCEATAGDQAADNL